MKKNISNIQYILKYAWSIDKLYLLLRIPIMLVSSIKPFILIMYPAKIIELIMDGTKLNYLIPLIIEMTMFQLISELLLFFLNKILTIRYNRFEYKHSLTLGKKIMSVSFPITEDTEVLNLVERIKGIGYIEKSFEALFSVFSLVITIIGLVWVLSVVNVFVMLTITIVLIINILLNRKSKMYNYQWQKEAAPYRRRNEYLLRLMYGFQYGKEVRINEMESYLSEKYEKHSSEYLLKLRKIGNKFFLINNLTSFAANVQLLVVYISLTISTLDGAISIAEFTKLINAINALSTSLVNFTNGFVEIKNNFNYVEDLRSFYTLEEKKYKNKKIGSQPITIEFDNVSFKYPNTSHYALKNISVTIKEKSKTTIVGLNGSGKTTFIKLMLGLYKPTSGHIYINGVNIEEFDLKEYWKHFSCAFQDFRIFAYSIKENVILKQEYKENKFNNILVQCGLDDVIEKLPLKINTPIYKFLDDTGVEFSGGENQKIAIARAIYKESDIVILDEPLAALDPISEYNMYYGIHRMVNERTCIFVSHRLSLARGCDQILVFDNGQLIENGTHDELMHLKEGKYAEMYKKQSSFYLTEGRDNDELSEY